MKREHTITHFIRTGILTLMLTLWSGLSFAASKQAQNLSNLNPKVLKLALIAYNNAKEAGYIKNEYLTIVDYSVPSSEPRMWVIDMKNQDLAFYTHVSHGMNSGGNIPTEFSNISGSNQSSLGVYITDNVYYGKHGKSLNLNGIEKGYNNNALARRIVVHAADYVSDDFIQRVGRLGRSQGCFAVKQEVSSEIIDTIKGGSVIFGYYPDDDYLSNSTLLNSNTSNEV